MNARRRRRRFVRLVLLALALYGIAKAVSFGVASLAFEGRISATLAELSGGSVEIGLADSDFWKRGRLFRTRLQAGGRTALSVERVAAQSERPFLFGDPGRLAVDLSDVTLDLDALRALPRAPSGPPSAHGAGAVSPVRPFAARVTRFGVKSLAITAPLPGTDPLAIDIAELELMPRGEDTLEATFRGRRVGPFEAPFTGRAVAGASGATASLELPPRAVSAAAPLRLGPFSFAGTVEAGFEASLPASFEPSAAEATAAFRLAGATLEYAGPEGPWRAEGLHGTVLAARGEPLRYELSFTLPAAGDLRLELEGQADMAGNALAAEGRMSLPTPPAVALLLGATLDLPLRLAVGRAGDRATMEAELGVAGASPFTLSLLVAGDGGTLRIRDARLRFGASTARLSAEVDLVRGLNAELHAEAVDLMLLRMLPALAEPLRPVASGVIESADLVFSAPPPATGAATPLALLRNLDPRALTPEGSVRITRLSADGVDFDELSCGFRLAGDGGVDLVRARIVPKGGRPLAVEGRFTPGRPFRGRFAIKDHALEAALLAPAGIQAPRGATVSGTLDIDGETLRFSGRARAARASLRGFPLPEDLPVDAVLGLAGGRPAPRSVTLGQPGGLFLRMTRDGDGHALEAGAPSFDPNPHIPAALAARAEPLRNLKVEARLSAAFAPQRATLSADALAFTRSGVRVRVDSPRVRLDGGRLVAADLAATVGGVAVALSVDYRLSDGRYDFSISGKNIDPAPLLAGSTGGAKFDRLRADLDLRLASTGAAPALSGSARISAARVDLPGMREPLRDLAVSLGTSGDSLAVREGSFRSGGAVWVVRGAVRPGKGPSPELDLTVENGTASLDLPGLLKAKGAAHLEVKGTLAAPRLGGRVRADEGVLTLPKDLTAGPGLDLSPAELDIALSAEKRFWVRADFLNAELKGDLRIRTKRGVPAFVGELETARGTFIVYGNEFRIEEGRVRFPDSDRLVPHLQLRAVARAGAHQVTADASGAVDSLGIALTSSPPLSQDEIVALLITGDPKGEVAGGGAPLATGGALVVDYTKGQVLGGIRNTLRDSLGLDDLSFDPGVKSGDRRGSNLRVGKYMSDKVYVQYSLEKSDELRKQERLDLDFKLDRKVDFNIRNETDRGSSFGVKVKNKF